MSCSQKRPATSPSRGTYHDRAYVTGSTGYVGGPRILYVQCPDCRTGWSIEDDGDDSRIKVQS